MKTIYDEFPDYDEFDDEGKRLLESLFQSKNYFRFKNDAEFQRFATSQEQENPLSAIRTSQSFNEISNEVAKDSPFGEESVFYNKEKEVFRLIPKSMILHGIKQKE